MLTSPEKSTIVRVSLPAVRLRPVPPGAAGPIVDAVFGGLSARSRYLRFHSPIPRLGAPLRRHLTDLDGRRRSAIVAEVGDTPVGLVELADVGDGAAEVAVAVVDAWQRRGIGGRLVRAAAELATSLGFTELRGDTLAENQAVRRLARRAFPLSSRRFANGQVRISVPLGPAAWSVTEADVLADLLYRGD